MIYPRLALLAAVLSAASGQSVRSTHSGLLYFFDGYVFIGDEQLQQKFGRFPELGEGRVLRTELGRAEILLTPGVFLRVAENTEIRMVSNSLSDTRVELQRGSAILEVSHEAANPADKLIYKDWQVRIAKEGVARIDSEPAQLRVYSGAAEVSAADGSGSANVQRGEVLPFASVLVAEQASTPAADAFNIWAMNRSSAVSEDNTIAAGITDDPDQLDSSGAALGNFSYFPQTGIPSLGITNPYGISFWNPYQLPFNSTYLPGYNYGLFYRPWPSATFLYPRPVRILPGNGSIVRPTGVLLPRPSYPLPPRIPVAPLPRVTAPRPGFHR